MPKVLSIFCVYLFAVTSIAEGRSTPTVPASLGVSIQTFEFEAVVQLINETGIYAKIRTLPSGHKTIEAKSSTGRTFYLDINRCDARESNCKGLVMFAFVTSDNDLAQKTHLANLFNTRFFFAKAAINKQGDTLLSRHTISDYGVSRGNIVVTLEVFKGELERFLKLNASSTAASAYSTSYGDSTLSGMLYADDLDLMEDNTLQFDEVKINSDYSSYTTNSESSHEPGQSNIHVTDHLGSQDNITSQFGDIVNELDITSYSRNFEGENIAGTAGTPLSVHPAPLEDSGLKSDELVSDLDSASYVKNSDGP